MKINKGFTLIELVIVLGIIGVLSAVGFTSYQGYVYKTNVSACLSEVKSYANLVYYNMDEQINTDSLPKPNVPNCDQITDTSQWNKDTAELLIQAKSKKSLEVNIQCNLAVSASCEII